MAVGFGEGRHAALAGADAVAGNRFCGPSRHDSMSSGIVPDARGNWCHASGDHGRLLHISHSILLAHEDKTFQGAFIASASIPWGQIERR